ncbi:MAG TPA: hypothetical protein VN363_05470 [Anaerolineales bacterium]|nr:hypothetical protein [Anaerolineales bacterium]
MSQALDLHLFSLVRSAGQDQTEPSGLHVASPPRRAARSRKADQLVLHLSLAGNAPLAPAHQDQLLARLAQVYYQSSGSVTAALRSLAEALNKYLLERNLKNAGSGRQAIGLLSLVVFKENQLYLAQSGPVHAYHLTAGNAQHIFDPQISGRGLGLSRNTPIRFFHALLEPNDTLLVATEADPSWSQVTLASLHGQGPESQRRKLLGRAGLDINAYMLQARPGKGLVTRQPAQSTRPAVTAGETPLVEMPVGVQLAPEQPEALDQSQTAADEGQPIEFVSQVPPAQISEPGSAPLEPVQTTETVEEIEPEEEPDEIEVGEDEAPASDELDQVPWKPLPQELPKIEQTAPSAAVDKSAAGDREASIINASNSNAVRNRLEQAGRAARPARSARRKGLDTSPLASALASAGRPIGGAMGAAGSKLKTVLERILPDESIFTIPTSFMAIIAIAVPLIIVVIATGVYTQLGRTVQYQTLFTQAAEQVRLADSQTDPLARRTGFHQSLVLLEQVEAYGITAETQEMRQHIQLAMDDLDNVRRLNYQPAIIGGLAEDISIARMLVVDNDLYLLDRNSGQVLRGLVTNNGYEIDRSFQCGPNASLVYQIGPLVDITYSPVNSVNAAVMGMDARGGIIKCYTSGSPDVEVLTLPSRVVDGDLTSLTYEQGNTYVLDPLNRAVWIYWNSKFDEEPQFFFGEEVPNLDDVVDMAVEKEQLYLLRATGNMAVCTYSGLVVSPTRCMDPAPYVDYRVDPAGVPLQWTDPFGAVLTTSSPDPSLYLFSPQTNAVFQFSLRTLAIQRQFMPAEALGNGAGTALAVNPVDRILIVAVHHRVYYAFIP